MGGGVPGTSGKGVSGVSGPGGLSGADVALAEQALGQNITAIHNRYQQLGLGTPASAATPTTNSATEKNLAYGSPSTMENMDVGTTPTQTGGAIGQEQALLGSLFNPTNAAGLGPGGPLQQLALQQQQQQQNDTNAGFAAGSSGSGSGGFGNTTNTTGDSSQNQVG